ncbi:transmembrane protein 35B [Trichosurus vulpecula]|uniref:transmembrane protein 35B n=1 Tax=Trichosurus vulpecula TaxID=9337 RepID=UPI00186B36B4|nr:transmembrane protein 35B [Trichosurus vulpecula]
MKLVFLGLRLLLGIFFMFTGAVKLSECHIPAQVHAQMKAQMVKFAEVLPLEALGYNPDPEYLLIVVGWVELVSGLLLAVGPPLLQELSSILLSMLMMVTVYTLVVLRESVSTCAPPTLCLGLLFLLFTRICQRS